MEDKLDQEIESAANENRVVQDDPKPAMARFDELVVDVAKMAGQPVKIEREDSTDGNARD